MPLMSRAAIPTSAAALPLRLLHPGEPPVIPGWVDGLTHTGVATLLLRNPISVRVTDAGDLTLLELTAPAADRLPPLEFQKLVARAYLVARDILAERQGHVPIRFWHYVPGIHRRFGELDAYMIFNAGRYAALTRWHGTVDVGPFVSAASAVGHDGDAFIMHVLAASSPATTLENPRQVPAHRYSERYGPFPPCFARAAKLPHIAGEDHLMLVSGTASIVGEDSRHPRSFERQLEETCRNLAALIRTASPAQGPFDDAALLARVRHLRAYIVNETDVQPAARILRETFTGLTQLELMPADLCRPELLIELDSVVSLA
jgi:hypothetical protein